MLGGTLLPEAPLLPDAAASPSRPRRRGSPSRSRPVRGTASPVLVRIVRGGIVESIHRGDIVEVVADGRELMAIGDPDQVVTLRSTAKPFGLVSLIEAGGVEAFDLSPAELALMASSHSGEDLHVRTIQAMYRRAHITQATLACGAEGMPLDELTAARLARDGERPGPVRHMCSGQHSVFLLLSKLHGWDPEGYWLPEHPAQAAYRAAVGRAFGLDPDRIPLVIDGCGVPTYALTLRDVARAYAVLAEPAALPATDTRRASAPALTIVRDAMLAHPEMVGGTHDRLDTSLMKAMPGRLVSKAGMEALRGVAILPGPRSDRIHQKGPSGLALKIEDGGGHERATWAATVEALRQVGVADGRPLRELARYHRPTERDPHGRVAMEAVVDFELVPVGELVG